MEQTSVKRLPQARYKQLLVQDLEDEILVYDLRSHRAYCLNAMAARIWKACDGKTTVAAIAAQLASHHKGSIGLDVIHLGLYNLARSGLLDEWPSWLPAKGAVSRRDLLRELGKTAAVIAPVVAALAVPNASQAATCPCPGIRSGDSCLGCVGCCGRRCTKRCGGTGLGKCRNPC